MRYIILLTFLFTGCASRIHQHILHDYSRGNFEVVEEKISQVINQNSQDRLLFLLNRGMTRFASGKSLEAVQDFKCALEAIDFYNQELFQDIAAELLIDDSSAPYKGGDFEQSLARLYFALALLNANDENNACAILQQAEMFDQRKRLEYCKNPLTQSFFLEDNRIQKILFTYLLEKRGDISNAQILKKQLDTPLPPYHPDKSLLIVLCHNGLAPIKISSYSPSSMVSMQILEMILGVNGCDPSICTCLGIPLPELCSPLFICPIPLTIAIGEQKKELPTYCDIGLLADRELQQKMPCIAAKAVARVLMRRALVGYVQEKDVNLGALFDLGMLAVNACTKADTRSWTTLPMTIDAAFFQLEPGTHQIHFTSSLFDYCHSMSTHQIKVQKGDICIVNVFNLHPGITKVLIPNKHKFEETLCVN